MDIHRFVISVHALYEGWGSLQLRPHSQLYAELLRNVPGMTTSNVTRLLGFAVACLEFGESYCEVGTHRGATLVGALQGNENCVAFACDNFSQFDPRRESETALHRNLTTVGLQDRVVFYNQDFEDFLPHLWGRKDRVGVYFYDGAHDYRSQLMGLLLAVPALADRAVIVIDDANDPAPRQAAWDFMAARPECRILFDLTTPSNGHPSWWNGLLVLGWDKGTSSGFNSADRKLGRQEELLQSLHALELGVVHLREESGKVRVVYKRSE